MRGNLTYQLKVDYSQQVLRLIILDYHCQLIDNSMSWSFSQLQSRLEHKMNYVALIPVKKWYINKTIYFLYLIEEGIIRVTFRISYFKDEERFGNIHDRGTTFEIREDDLTKLFDEI